MITQLQEQTRQMNDAIAACDSAIESGDVSAVPDTILNIGPDFKDPQYTKIGLTNGDTTKQVLFVCCHVSSFFLRFFVLPERIQ